MIIADKYQLRWTSEYQLIRFLVLSSLLFVADLSMVCQSLIRWAAREMGYRGLSLLWVLGDVLKSTLENNAPAPHENTKHITQVILL